MSKNEDDLKKIFKQSFTDSVEAIQSILELNPNYNEIVKLLINNSNKPFVVCALGKSGYIAAKLAATLKSLDIKAEYLHASEALHGDLGSISSESFIILISHSGETEEVVSVAQESINRGSVCLAITAHQRSRLGETCKNCILLPVDETVCRLGIAPMSSTTASLVICDAIANVLSSIRKIKVDAFRKNHPGGKLGKLLTPVGYNMVNISTSFVSSKTLILDSLEMMSGTGFILIKDEKPKSPLGIFTDGDLRRLLQKGFDIKSTAIGDHCSYNPVTVSMDTLTYEVDTLMSELGVTSILVMDNNKMIVGTYPK